MCRKTDVLGRLLGFLLLVPALAGAAPELPPAPSQHFNDYAQLVTPAEASRLDQKLRALEQSSTVQLVVAIFPELPSPSLEDFTVRTAQAWGIGQKQPDNGAVLFVFVKDRKSRLEVGYGLEDEIPDATARRILQDVMSPYFKQGQFAAGLGAAIDAVVAAATGAPLPVADVPRRARNEVEIPEGLVLIFIIGIIVVFALASRHGGGGTYTSGGWTGGGWSGGGWSSGGGGFSGGGGSFGGGGASGNW
jgi:uncharacterized protein